jgi:hypothetical protein
MLYMDKLIRGSILHLQDSSMGIHRIAQGNPA